MDNNCNTIAPLRKEEREGDESAPPLFLFTPMYLPLVLLKYALQETINAHLAARNEMQIEIARRMFPDTERQIACLCSEVCRKRTSNLLRRKPWFVSLYLSGLQDFVIEMLTRDICHRCSLKKSPA